MALHDSIPKLGARNTKQRTAVVEVLREMEKFSSAKEIYHELQEREEKVGLTTVYRTLQSLTDIDAVDALHMPNGETLYRHCETDAHHHHLVCTKCGRTEEIDGIRHRYRRKFHLPGRPSRGAYTGLQRYR